MRITLVEVRESANRNPLIRDSIGSVEISVRVTNVSSQSVWIGGYSLDSLDFTLLSRKVDSDELDDYGAIWCGTGVKFNRIRPGATGSGAGRFPAKYLRQELRARITVFDSLRDKVPVTVSSPPILFSLSREQ